MQRKRESEKGAFGIWRRTKEGRKEGRKKDEWASGRASEMDDDVTLRRSSKEWERSIGVGVCGVMTMKNLERSEWTVDALQILERATDRA